MLVFAFQSEIWIVQNFNFTVFEDFCLSLSWKYRFLQNVNHAKVQSKTNKYCKFHVDLTRGRLSKNRFKKLGMVPKKLYRNTLKSLYGVILKWCKRDLLAPRPFLSVHLHLVHICRRQSVNKISVNKCVNKSINIVNKGWIFLSCLFCTYHWQPRRVVCGVHLKIENGRNIFISMYM